MSREEAQRRIRAALFKRSGRRWSVRCEGEGLRIGQPGGRVLPPELRDELARLLGLDPGFVEPAGLFLPAEACLFIEGIQRAERGASDLLYLSNRRALRDYLAARGSTSEELAACARPLGRLAAR